MLAVLEASPPATAYFPAELVALARHPSIEALGSEVQRQVHARHLLRYLHFTRALEIATVNRLSEEMCFPTVSTGLWNRLPATARQHLNDEAYSIYAEEAEHALEAHKLLQQIEGLAGVRWDRRELPERLKLLHQRIAAEADSFRGFLLLFGFVCVSETLVTQTLCRLPTDTGLLPAIRSFAADHARDEARHARFFSALFAQVWRVLTADEKNFLGCELACFVRMFGEMDAPSVTAELDAYGLTSIEIRSILRDLRQGSPTQLRQEAARALRMFEEAGVFQNPAVRASFVAQGLLDATE